MTGKDETSRRESALVRIKEALGPRGWIGDPNEAAPFLADQRGMFDGACALVALPSSCAQVAEIVGICAQAGIPVVPQGGNTGLVGGGIPKPADGAVLVSLNRMNRIRNIDPLDYTITVEAGCILADIQNAAAEADRMFPLSLGAEGTCQIGGNLSTNAGGVNVLRYGTARDLTLGLEVVLPDGRIWDGLKRLRKDNTGYDLKQLYIGGEGTLGIITAAVCKLFARPRDVQTAMVGLRDLDAALVLLARARDASGDRVTGFELICRDPFAAAVAHIPGIRDPLAQEYDAYVLFELTGASADSGMKDALEATLGGALESGEIGDAAIAQSNAQRADFWRLREAVVEAQQFEGPSFKHDVSVAVSRVPAFIRRANAAVNDIAPGARPFAFGHCGDGNIHYNVIRPRGMNDGEFLAMRARVTHAVYDIVVDMGGSFSAEHGVGQLKLDEMARYKIPLELTMMRQIKTALDPAGTMNPGKMLQPS